MSQHYYRRDGTPCHEVPKKDGGMRAINLRWDRHLNLVPSVTTVLGVIDKPNLVNWKVRQGILAALTLPRMPNESDESYLHRVVNDSEQQVEDSADEGNQIHWAIEQGFRYGEGSIPEDYRPHCGAVYTLLHKLFPDVHDWIPEKTFAHPLGFGGTVDLHSPSTGIIVDFKSKDGDFSDEKRLHYDQHWQLAAYQVGLGLAESLIGLGAEPFFHPGAAIFVSRTHPGKVSHYIWSAEDMMQGWKVFHSALGLWSALKNYYPAWSTK